jgi:hypothetical protein
MQLIYLTVLQKSQNQEVLSFDQLYASLTDLFMDFIETFQRGEGVQIISRTDNTRVGIFS